MASNESESTNIGKGRGIWKPQYNKKVRRPRDELIEKGKVLAEEKQDEYGSVLPGPKEDSVVMKFDSLQISNTRDSSHKDEKYDKNEEYYKEQKNSDLTNTIENVVQGTYSTYQVLLNAVDTPPFCPQAQRHKLATTGLADNLGHQDQYQNNGYYVFDNNSGVTESWDEYLQDFEVSSDICINPDFLEAGNPYETDQQTLDIFKNLLDEITIPPFDKDLYEFAVTLLCEWVQLKETYCAMAFIIIERGIEDQAFRFPGGRLAGALSEVSKESTCCGGDFRSDFLEAAQIMYDKAVASLNSRSPEATDFVTGLAMFFGELLNSMKIEGKVIFVFKSMILDLVDHFLKGPNEKLLRCLVQLLKLTGPVLDSEKENSKANDVHKMFEKVQQFGLSSSSQDFPSLREGLLKVYRLHTRDWDRCATPLETSGPKCDSLEEAPSSQDLGPYASEESMGGFLDARTEGVYGTDKEIEEIDNAFEEFLRMSGQI